MSEFIPPYPPRLPAQPSAWQRLKAMRKNILAGWEENAFYYEFVSAKILSRRVFLCNSPDSVQFALNSHNSSFERKSAQHRHSLSPLLGDGLFVSDGETWRERRRIVAPVVHVSRLPDFAPVMVQTALEARERWANLPAGAEIDVLGEMAQLTAEIICRTIFGSQLGRAHASEVVSGFSDYQRYIMKTDFISLLGLPDWLPRWYSPRVRRAVKRIHGVLERIIDESRQQRDRNEASIIGRLFDAQEQDGGVKFDQEALRNEAAVLFMAGHETTANSLAWTWYLLSQSPRVQTRLLNELDRVLGGRAPTLDDVPNLVYTRAVFEETMRLYPPVPMLTREALVDENFNGVTIPKGSMILVSPWLLHRHKRLWHKPDHFVPERFMPAAKGPVSKFAYIPFSIGPRICAGMAFGLTEAILCIATLAQQFKLQLKEGHQVEIECHLTLRPGATLPMVLQRREPRRRAATRPARVQTPAPPPVCPVHHGVNGTASEPNRSGQQGDGRATDASARETGGAALS
ncbi:MAG TPA: cytochrome P450 [Pseudolabrys sp.]|nr:cytochrome P450 [Pseudolabrys sp.]